MSRPRIKTPNSHNASSTYIAEEEVQHTGDQQGAFEQVCEDGFECGVDEPGAIIEGDNLHALRQHRAIERRDFLFKRGQHFRRILTFAHQHNPGNCLIVFVLANDALARHRAHADLRQVFYQEGRPVTLGHYHIANIVARAEQANTPGSDTAGLLVPHSSPQHSHCPVQER